MRRYLLTALPVLLLAVNAWTQETDSGSEPDPEVGVRAEDADEASEIDEEFEDELDRESYAEAEEEDFVPTEDIPTDQSIPFPTDI